MRHLVGTILLICMATSTSASQNSCGKFTSPQTQDQAENCSCDVKHIHIESPFENMKLIAVCDFAEERFDYGERAVYGEFIFRGTQTFVGKIRLEFNAYSGDELRFIGKKIPPKEPFYDRYIELRFENAESAIKKFRVPNLTTSKNCMEAKIKLRANEIVKIPSGGDSSGNYVRGYEALEIGTYHRCNPAP